MPTSEEPRPGPSPGPFPHPSRARSLRCRHAGYHCAPQSLSARAREKQAPCVTGGAAQMMYDACMYCVHGGITWRVAHDSTCRIARLDDEAAPRVRARMYNADEQETETQRGSKRDTNAPVGGPTGTARMAPPPPLPAPACEQACEAARTRLGGGKRCTSP